MDFDCDYMEVQVILKMGWVVVDINEVFIDDFLVFCEDFIGEEGKGFEYLFYLFNLECILIGIEVVGIGQNVFV